MKKTIRTCHPLSLFMHAQRLRIPFYQHSTHGSQVHGILFPRLKLLVPCFSLYSHFSGESIQMRSSNYGSTVVTVQTTPVGLLSRLSFVISSMSTSKEPTSAAS